MAKKLFLCFFMCNALYGSAQTVATISIAHNVSKYQTDEFVQLRREDEQCTLYLHSNSYGYTCLGYPSSNEQTYFKKRFEALEKEFEQKN